MKLGGLPGCYARLGEQRMGFGCSRLPASIWGLPDARKLHSPCFSRGVATGWRCTSLPGTKISPMNSANRFWLIQRNQLFPEVILDCIGRTWIAARRQRTVSAKIKPDLLCGGHQRVVRRKWASPDWGLPTSSKPTSGPHPRV